MLRKMARDAADGARRAQRRRPSDSSASSAGEAQGLRPSRRGRRPGDASEDTEDAPASSAAEGKAVRLKGKAARLAKAARMRRAPLLEREIVESVYSAVAGEARKAARGRLRGLFARHDPDERGWVSLARFRKCLDRAGVKLERVEDCESLARCFVSPVGGSGETSEDEEDELRVDYAAFTDFACSTRDSALLSELADHMQRVITKYDRKRGVAKSSSGYNMGSDLKKLDKAKQGWITSERAEKFFDRLGDGDGPAFKLSGQQIAAIVDRFEFEYEKETLGFDYVQFSQWLQPLLHLDVKQLHARVKDLILQASKQRGWELDEVFEAMDEDRDGEVDALELKEALVEMGLPLTDTQIRALVEEYDINGDGQIQYREFVSLFAHSSAGKGGKIKKKANASASTKKGSDDDGSDSTPAKTKTRGKRNVRNTFSWGIAKAFARKQAAQSARSKVKGASARTKKKGVLSSEDSDSVAETTRMKKVAASNSSDESEEPKQVVHKKPKARRASPSSESSSSHEGAAKVVKHKRAKDVSDNQSEDSSIVAKPARKPHKRDSRTKSTTTAKRDVSSTDSEAAISRKRAGAKQKLKRDKKTSDSEEKKKSASDNGGDSRKKRQPRAKLERSPTRRERLRSTASERPDKSGTSARPRSPVKRTSRLPSSRSSRRFERRKSTQSVGHSPKRHQRRNSRANQPKASHRRSRSRTRRDKSSSPNDGQGSGSADNSDGTGSGIDAEQLRQMKRSSLHRGSSDIANGVDDCDGDDDGYTASDAEYYRHLKRALRRAFDFFDLDKSDAIEKRELDHILRALGHDVTPKELEAELKRSDLDRNGRLDFYEFVAFVKRQLRCKAYLLTQKREMEIRQAFEALDTDKNGVLDEKEFEYMVFKVLQVELSVEEQDALLDFVDVNGDGAINEEEFIAFMKTMEEFYKRSGGTGPRSMKRQNRFLASLDGTSRLACSAMKKLVRGAPLDIDRNLLMFFDIPTNFRPAISSAATCRLLNANTMAHALSFPSPQVVTALTHSGQRLLDAREPSMLNLIKRDEVSAERHILQQAESFESQAVVSLKRATGVPKPFDTREDDVVKRCVHVCLFQEREEVQGDAGPGNPRFARKMKTTGSGVVVGNIHEVPVYWHPGEEDVWEFSKKTTKEDKYKFLLRTSAVNDRLYLLVEFIVHLRMSKHERRRSKRGKARSKRSLDNAQEKVAEGAREMVCCWCKIPVRDLVTKRPDPMRVREKLWGGTAHAPVDIEQDEILRRRTGWRAVANLFSKPTPPGMGVKSVAIESIPEDLQRCVPKMPPTIIAPFVSLPILAEYMQLMQNMLTTTAHPSSVLMCDPVLQLLPKIVDDHEALTVFRRVFDAEMAPLKTPEQRQHKFRELVLRMWPSFVDWRDRLPASLLASSSASKSTRRLSITGAPAAGRSPANEASGKEEALSASDMRAGLLHGAASGKLRLQDVNVPCAPFHVREVAFQRRL